MAAWRVNCLRPFRVIRAFRGELLVLGALLCCGPSTPLIQRLGAAEKTAEQFLRDAGTAFERGETEQALALAKKAIDAEPKNPRGYYVRGRMHDTLKQYGKAVADYDKILKLNRNAKEIHQLRGIAHFKLGNIQQSIADFDRFIQLEPSQAPHHWQRGISYYYAGHYTEGRKQFELHQTVNPNDVENAVWHFLCVARSDNVKKAREALIPIQRDARVPMMEVHALFAGKGSDESVLAAAKAGEPPPDELRGRLFYAHLYLGLYHEALENPKLAKEHLAKAALDYAMDHTWVMWYECTSSCGGKRGCAPKRSCKNNFRFSESFRGRVRSFPKIRDPKLEIRYKTEKTEIRISKPCHLAPFCAFELSGFEFVSDFGFRASDLSCPNWRETRCQNYARESDFVFAQTLNVAHRP